MLLNGCVDHRDMKQSTTDRLVGMVVTLIAGFAIILIQHRLVVFVRRRKPTKKETKKATNYGDPFFRARWGKGAGDMEIVEHRGSCGCGRFCFRVIAPSDLKALDCPGRVRYPHIFIPATAFQPLSDLRLLTLHTARSSLSHVVVHAFCSKCGVPVFRASDGAVDTIIINVDCLDGSTISSVEMAYYEDLVAFPASERVRLKKPRAHLPALEEHAEQVEGRLARRRGEDEGRFARSSQQPRDLAQRSSTGVPSVMRLVLGLLTCIPGSGLLLRGPTSRASYRAACGRARDEAAGEKGRRRRWEEEEGETRMVEKESLLWRGWAEACLGAEKGGEKGSRRGCEERDRRQAGRQASARHKGGKEKQTRQQDVHLGAAGVGSSAWWEEEERGRQFHHPQPVWGYEDEENAEPPSMDQLRYHLKRHLNGDTQRLPLANGSLENSFLPIKPAMSPQDAPSPAPASVASTATMASEAACPLQDSTGRVMSDINVSAEALLPMQAEKGGLTNGVHSALNGGDHKLANGHAELMTL